MRGLAPVLTLAALAVAIPEILFGSTPRFVLAMGPLLVSMLFGYVYAAGDQGNQAIVSVLAIVLLGLLARQLRQRVGTAGAASSEPVISLQE